MSTADRDSRQRRSRIISDMARKIKLDNCSINRHDRSFASSTGSKHGSVASSISRHGSSQHGTVSRDSTRSTDFDPERDEALVSTQRMDFDVSISQKLPQLRETARKYGQWQPRKAEDFKINTSAIGRAFPDFTQGDTELSLSIEQPRARLSNTDHQKSLDASPLATRVNGARLRGSPRGPRPQSPILEALSRQEDKENVAPRSHKSAGSAYVSQASHTTNINAYRDPSDSINIDNDTFSTLPLPSPLPKEFQARVDSDMSMSSFADSSLAPFPSKPNISQPMVPRSSPLKMTTQAPDSDIFTSTSQKSQASSSFDVGKPSSSIKPPTLAQPTSTDQEASRPGIASSSTAQVSVAVQLAQGKQLMTTKPTTKVGQAAKPTSTAQPTQSSFVITAPAVTEKVPAIIVKPFTQQGKILTRRSRQRPVDGFEQDCTEENIYDMIDMLQDKVAELEMVNKSHLETITGFQKDNEQLLSEKMRIEAADTETQNIINELQKRETENQNKIKELKAAEKETQNIIKELQKKDTEKQNIIRDLQRKDTEKHTIIKKAQNTIKELQMKAANYENNTRELRKKAADYDLVHNINSQANRHITNLKKEIGDHEAINIESQQTIATLQQTIQALTEEKEIIVKEHAQAMEENEQVDAENKRVGKEFEKLAKEYHEVVTEHHKTVKESRWATRKIQQLSEENATLSASNSEAHNTITSLKNNLTQQDNMFTEKVTIMDKNLEDFKRETRSMGRRRIPSDDADATMRPAQDPREALDEVIDRAEQKMAKLKQILMELEAAFRAHDPAMGKRARKALREQIDSTVKQIDEKGDRIYQLYDIKEGLAY
ncbi:hypothetical protein WAI453_004646 [Rhynchosporium graminicola]|uniref:Cep57 centrosome microtubule-binding domain-containing protein n=1 Tax=Rhynchosporium graminicola TaxID=2792576 RepID=A0A1E1LMA7_9HELO|nr:uncharacterized protein RCO7_03774 [Rhynchosporium commune]